MKRQFLIVFIFFIIYFSTPNHFQHSVEAVANINDKGTSSEIITDDIDDSSSFNKLDHDMNYLDDKSELRKRSWKNLQSSWGKRQLNYLIGSGGTPSVSSSSSSIDDYNVDDFNRKKMEKKILNDLIDAIDMEHLSKY